MKATGTMRSARLTGEGRSPQAGFPAVEIPASIIGSASSSSRKLKRVTPTCNQRRAAPFTHVAGERDRDEQHDADHVCRQRERISVCGGTCATIHIATSATPRLT